MKDKLVAPTLANQFIAHFRDSEGISLPCSAHLSQQLMSAHNIFDSHESSDRRVILTFQDDTLNHAAKGVQMLQEHPNFIIEMEYLRENGSVIRTLSFICTAVDKVEYSGLHYEFSDGNHISIQCSYNKLDVVFE